MIMFASDLDNTLLFSYKHKTDEDICVEYLDGREQGFFTQSSIAKLKQVREKTLFIPVTTRSIEQYKRIHFPPECMPKYAVTTNGAILLVNGEIDAEWIEQSRQIVEPWREELAEIQKFLAEIPQIKRFRMVDDMYMFAACDNIADAEESERLMRGKTKLEAAVSGRKLYFFPPSINKGSAIRRLKERFVPKKVISAGDSVIDIPMLLNSDVAIVPDNELLPKEKDICVFVKPEAERFPDFIVNCVLREII